MSWQFNSSEQNYNRINILHFRNKKYFIHWNDFVEHIHEIDYFSHNVNTHFFLLCLIDMNKLRIYFDNIVDKIIQKQFHRFHSIIRQYDHVFLLWYIFVYIFIIESFDFNSCFFIEIELRRFHRRFDHFFVHCLHQILQRTQRKIDLYTLKHFTKYYKHCQMHDKLSKRFNFSIKK